MSTELVTAQRPMGVPVGQEVDALERVAHNLASAGIYRKTAKNPAEVFAILLAARDLGVAPTSALAGGIHMVEGKPEVSANLQAQLLREYRGPEGQRYDFRILTPARERATECHIEFRRREVGEPWEVIGEEIFAMADAERAGLAGKDNYKKYPKMMLLARCLSDGIASHCPETARGLRVYGEGEIGGTEPRPPISDEPSDSEPLNGTIVDEPQIIAPESASMMMDALREIRATGGTIRGWLIDAGADVPATGPFDASAAVAGLTVVQAEQFGTVVLAALDEYRAAGADTDALVAS